jgi:glycosyltransferase involved in cell wall biosynthesis
VKAAFVINARNKAKWVGDAVRGALAQTYPCEIVLSDQSSEDGTYEAMEKELAQVPKHHSVKLLRCPVGGKYGMAACNAHFMWCAEQTEAEWIFQCSADDYSLPERVSVCMEALRSIDHKAAVIANTMFFVNPGEKVGPQTPMTGFPLVSGYVRAGEGLHKMAYGSTIHGFRRDWLLTVGSAGDSTMDVFYGYLAALNEGFYVVANPQHVHVQHAEPGNMGFQGKLRAAEASGDAAQLARINELNRFQLLELYYATAVRAQALYPMAHQVDRDALLNMIIAQAAGWLSERKNLHANGWTPGVL